MKNEKGLTLIELVVSIAVLSILIVPFFGIFTNAAKLDIRSKNEITANYLAQQIIAEVKNNPGIFDQEADWKTESDINLNDLFGPKYKDFSANIKLSPFTLSISSNGIENEIQQNNPDVDFEIEWNKNDKSFFYIWEGVAFTEEIEDTSSNFEFIIEECKNNGDTDKNCDDCQFYEDVYEDEYKGPYKYHVAIKVDNNNYWVTIPFNTDSGDSVIGIKLLESDINNGSNKITIDNKTDVPLKVFTSDDADHVDIEKKNASTDVEINPPISESDDGTSKLQCLTVEITGYDPIGKEYKILKRIITTVK